MKCTIRIRKRNVSYYLYWTGSGFSNYAGDAFLIPKNEVGKVSQDLCNIQCVEEIVVSIQG